MTTRTLDLAAYDSAAPKQTLHIPLNEDLVRKARTLTPNLSDTIEQLLAKYVQAKPSKSGGEQATRRLNRSSMA